MSLLIVRNDRTASERETGEGEMPISRVHIEDRGDEGRRLGLVFMFVYEKRPGKTGLGQ